MLEFGPTAVENTHRRRCLLFLSLGLTSISQKSLWAAAGTEGGSFLDIPVGAASIVGNGLLLYTAMANDAYAPVWEILRASVNWNAPK